MTCVTFEAGVIARLETLSELVEIRDESGRTIGYFHPVAGRKVSSPFSREEIEQRRQQRTGRPLAEVLEDLPRS
jgi:hypothetical protein